MKFFATSFFIAVLVTLMSMTSAVYSPSQKPTMPGMGGMSMSGMNGMPGLDHEKILFDLPADVAACTCISILRLVIELDQLKSHVTFGNYHGIFWSTSSPDQQTVNVTVTNQRCSRVTFTRRGSLYWINRDSAESLP
ncbi:hypothetical protein GE061_011971 [Apolygus lucorum]|uniref:Uncharacterized protein n=1 Tax=Apolygus lucorum TaxID=248454 RepID=A0A8S9XSB7_APOLU|nr:hypothetical protein GE061_011971 [Apolygus lucorum]